MDGKNKKEQFDWNTSTIQIIKKPNIEKIALLILGDFPIHYKLPASLSGKTHIGETGRQHLELAVNIMKHLCEEFNIIGSDRDMLIGATWLHDIGVYVISKKGKIEEWGWKYYSATDYSRIESCMRLHPLIGANILNNYDIPRKKEIQRLIKVHMSHWYYDCPNPQNLHEHLICVADYIASYGKGIFEYKE